MGDRELSLYGCRIKLNSLIDNFHFSSFVHIRKPTRT